MRSFRPQFFPKKPWEILLLVSYSPCKQSKPKNASKKQSIPFSTLFLFLRNQSKRCSYVSQGYNLHICTSIHLSQWQLLNNQFLVLISLFNGDSHAPLSSFVVTTSDSYLLQPPYVGILKRSRRNCSKCRNASRHHV